MGGKGDDNDGQTDLKATPLYDGAPKLHDLGQRQLQPNGEQEEDDTNLG